MQEHKDYKLQSKLKRLLEYVEAEIKNTHDSHPMDRYYIRAWNKGYRKAMITVRDFLWKILNEEH